MRSSSGRFFLGASLVMVSLLAANACRERQAEPPPAQYTVYATIKDIMDSMVDPSADVVWDSVATVVTASGAEERAPKTDKEWATVREAAIRVFEGANLLLMPGRHVARPHEKSTTPGVELEPEEMEALIVKDPAKFRERAKALQDAAMEALKAIDTKNAAALTDIGAQIDEACENCHVQYWYPNQKLPPGYEETAPLRRSAATPSKP